MFKITIFKNQEKEVKVLFHFPESLTLRPNQVDKMYEKINSAVVMVMGSKTLENYTIDLEAMMKGGVK